MQRPGWRYSAELIHGGRPHPHGGAGCLSAEPSPFAAWHALSSWTLRRRALSLALPRHACALPARATAAPWWGLAWGSAGLTGTIGARHRSAEQRDGCLPTAGRPASVHLHMWAPPKALSSGATSSRCLVCSHRLVCEVPGIPTGGGCLIVRLGWAIQLKTTRPLQLRSRLTHRLAGPKVLQYKRLPKGEARAAFLGDQGATHLVT